MNPVISIIVPVYKVERYLEKCIDSVLTQSLSNLELILVDDGSPDKCGEICDKYACEDKRVRVIHKKNGGPSQARNLGIKVAKGEYIGFVDSDDWIDENMYEMLYEKCKEKDSKIGVIGIREIDGYGNIVSEYKPNTISLSEICNKAYACNKIFKKNLFESNNLYFSEGRYFEDIELIPKLYVKADNVVIVEDIGYNYLKRSDSITSDVSEKIMDFLWAYTQISIFLKDNCIYDQYKEEYNKSIVNFWDIFLGTINDYPTMYLLKNFATIIKGVSILGGVSVKKWINFIFTHFEISIKREVFKFINRL